MLAGLPLAIALLAAGAAPASAAPADPAPTKVADGAAKAADRCVPAPPTTSQQEIVVCVQKPQGYRLDPDVMEANRAKRSGRPKRPERLHDNSCAIVGPAGCMGAGAGINLLAAAITAATMAARLSKGEEIGSMFRTTPEPTEYQLYLEAKRNREADEADAAAVKVAKAKAAQAAAAAGQAEGVQAKAGPTR